MTDRDPYRCDCGAELDHPGAYCFACGAEPPDYTPEQEGPDAADLWEADQARRRREDRIGANDVVGVLILAPFAALIVVGLLVDARDVDALIMAWKASACAWLAAVTP